MIKNYSFYAAFFLMGLLFLSGSVLHAQVVNGTVSDSETGDELPGVNILVKGTGNIGTATNTDGWFELSVPSMNDTLIFSYIGYQTLEVPINGQQTLHVELQEASILGDEVVVVGYGTQRRSEITTSVASLNAEDFNVGISGSPEQLMQGRVSGVNVTSQGGQPGAPVQVTIRGQGTLRSGSGPLYVIDGVAINNVNTTYSANTFGLGSSSATNPLSFLNPNDIESIDVLKDASATAIYGSRGSEGVILITTKRGTEGQSQLNYKSDVTISNVANRVDMLSADEFADFHNSVGQSDLVNSARTNWFDEITRTAVSNNHSLSYSNRSATSDFIASLNFSNQEGIIIASNLESYGGRLRANQRFLENRLELGFNLLANQTHTDYAPVANQPDTNIGDMLTNALTQNPTNPVYLQNGSLFPITEEGFNPLRAPELLTNFSDVTRVLSSASAEFEIAEGFFINGNFGLDRSIGSTISQISRHNIPRISNPMGGLVDAKRENTTYQLESTVNYLVDIQNHSFGFLGGYSWQKFIEEGRSWSISNFSTEEIEAYHNPGIGTELTISGNRPSGFYQENQLQSFFGRANYNFINRYFVTATLRADGSSRFGSGNRYGFFPSFSGAWQISDEDFMGENSILSNLRLRIGWGRTGNQEIPNGITEQLINVSTGGNAGYGLHQGQITPGITFVRIQNEDIKWEVSNQTNVGLDFGFFSQSLTGSVEVFNKVSTDILFEQTTGVDPINATTSYWSNFDMEIVNRGLEVELNYLKNLGVNAFFEIGGNVSFLDNEVKDLPVSILQTGSLTGQGLSGETVQAVRSGLPIGAFWLLEFEGLDENGLNQFRDVNGDGAITNADRVFAGSALPDLTYGLTANFGFKNWALGLNFNGVAGNKIYWNDHNALFTMPQLYAGKNIARAGFEPNEDPSNSATASTRFLQDGDYFRFSNATLSYDVNTTNLPLRGLQLSVTGQNLFTITDYEGFDPEVNMPRDVGGIQSYGIDSSRYPTARSVMFSVNVTL
ncbi:SusC/RagA family TonB-linked outer membrane protein [Rhodohalobacter sp. 614A]|uniref:SusC/RagA family TonB-linked outer membrane protein n=1 Tax=Rhodohalobacter sp. 614A TaxID=2908649 RepID=UPI001F15E812|nr:SusC/RagA family TonB-linked outer membrane protein [Rhodohalobacter sp. 614A]